MSCIFFLWLRKFTGGADSFSQFHLRSAARNFYDPATDLVPGLMLDDVFINAGGDKLLHSQLQSSLLGVNFEHQCFYRLPHFQDILGMINALLRADVANVNHAFNALGELHKCAKLSQTHNWTFYFRTN